MATPFENITGEEEKKIKVLVADDSPTVRLMLCHMLSGDENIQVVGSASNGHEAVQKVKKLKPDLVTMDVNMPVMDGLKAIEQIMAYHPVPVLVVSSVIDDEHVSCAAEALGAGAVDVISKPVPQSHKEFEFIADSFREKVKLLSRVRVVTHPRARLLDRSGMPKRLGDEKKLIAIASSTGGPQALEIILSNLPKGLKAGVVIVQHIAEGFTEGLVRWISGNCELDVRVGKDYEVVKEGEIVFAPDGTHMVITPGNRIRLIDTSCPSPHKPCADVLFESVAEVCGSKSIGVILTGMGKDGAMGIKAIRDSGGHTIAQNEETSVIFSMAKEAINLGSVEKIAPLEEISDLIMDCI